MKGILATDSAHCCAAPTRTSPMGEAKVGHHFSATAGKTQSSPRRGAQSRSQPTGLWALTHCPTQGCKLSSSKKGSRQSEACGQGNILASVISGRSRSRSFARQTGFPLASQESLARIMGRRPPSMVRGASCVSHASAAPPRPASWVGGGGGGGAAAQDGIMPQAGLEISKQATA